MFLTKDGVSFKDLEEIAFKIACEFANEILKNMLEEYDKKIMDARDKAKYRHKGQEERKLRELYGIEKELSNLEVIINAGKDYIAELENNKKRKTEEINVEIKKLEEEYTREKKKQQQI